MLFDLLIIATVWFSALAWGGNEPWAAAVVAAAAPAGLAGRLIWASRTGCVGVWKSWTLIPMPAFLAYVGLQMLSPRTGLGTVSAVLPHTVEPHTTRLYALIALAWVALVLAVIHGFDSRERVRKLILSVVALAAFEAAYGLAQSVGGLAYIWNFPVEGGFARGTFVNRNHYALLLNLGFCAGFGYLHYRAGALTRGSNPRMPKALGSTGSAELVWIALWLAFIGFGLVMSMSRTGIIAMFAALAVMSVAGRRSARGKLMAAAALAVLLGAAVLALYASRGSGQAPHERVLEAPSRLETDRMPIWRDAVKMIRANPLTGTGLGTFQWTFGAWESFEPDVPARYAHNDYLQALAEVGVPGFLILLAGWAVFWKTAWTNARQSRDPLVQGTGVGALGALTAVALQEATDFSLYIPGVSMCFALVVGLNFRVFRGHLPRSRANREDLETAKAPDPEFR